MHKGIIPFFNYNTLALSFEDKMFLKYQKRLAGFDSLFFVDENLDEYKYFVITDIVRKGVSIWM